MSKGNISIRKILDDWQNNLATTVGAKDDFFWIGKAITMGGMVLNTWGNLTQRYPEVMVTMVERNKNKDEKMDWLFDLEILRKVEEMTGKPDVNTYILLLPGITAKNLDREIPESVKQIHSFLTMSLLKNVDNQRLLQQWLKNKTIEAKKNSLNNNLPRAPVKSTKEITATKKLKL